MPVTSPRQSATAFPVPQTDFHGDWQGQIDKGDFSSVIRILVDWIKFNANVLHRAVQGKLNNTGTVTLATSSATTTISDIRISRHTFVLLIPQSASAATEWGAGSLYMTYPNAAEGAAVINHVNSATADRDFGYTLFG